MTRPIAAALLAALLAMPQSGCRDSEFPEGTPLNPIRVFFVTSSEVDSVRDSSHVIVSYLERETKLKFQARVSQGYQTVIEGMGTADADLAFMPTNAYVKASAKYGAEVALVTTRYGGQRYYRAQFIVRSDSNIQDLTDLEGKVWGFGDYNSTSGYVIPAQMLKNRRIRVKEELVTGSHPNTVQAVYEGKVDVGTTYWSPNAKDARMTRVTEYPDVFDKVKILQLTDNIPNDTVTFRKGFDPAMKATIVAALQKLTTTAEGKKALAEMYSIDGLVPVKSSFYDNFRKILKGEAVEVKTDDSVKNLKSTKGDKEDPFVVAGPAHEGLLGHGSIATRRVDVAGTSRIGQLTAKVDTEDFARADVAVLDLVDAVTAMGKPHKCKVFAVGEMRLGPDHLSSHRRIAVYGRPGKLPKGLFSLADKSLKAAIEPAANVRPEIFAAYARQLDLDPDAMGTVKTGEAPDDVDVILALLPQGKAERDGFIVYQVSPPFPIHVAVASKRLSPLAYKKLFELVIGDRETPPYPGVVRFSRAGAKAIGPWGEWLKAKPKPEGE